MKPAGREDAAQLPSRSDVDVDTSNGRRPSPRSSSSSDRRRQDSGPLHTLALCDGFGGFELALRLAGVRSRTVCRVERDAYATSILVERMEREELDPCPLWDELESFDGRPWRGRVDLITAGFPCQPWSIAGTWSGVEDPRWLWPYVADVIADVGPSYVLLENTVGINPRRSVGGLPQILTDLADFGFDAEWGVLTAASVGATHRRPRFWLLAHHRKNRNDEQDRWVAHSNRRRCEEIRARQEDLHAHRPSSPWPPRDDDLDGWREWLGAGGPEPSLRRRVDGNPPSLADPLHLAGEGLVPIVAASALAALAARAGWGVISPP